MPVFKIQSPFVPTGDQPRAIDRMCHSATRALFERDELKANLLRITGDVAMGVAALAAGGKGATL